MSYAQEIENAASLVSAQGDSWSGINPESVARMRAQNKFKTGLDIAKYTAKIMRRDMAAYDADSSQYTQSLGCWHGFIGQQKLISIKKHLQKPCLFMVKSTHLSIISFRGWGIPMWK